MSRLTALLGILAIPVLLDAQTPAPPAQPRFEAATLKVNTSGEARGQISAVPESGRLTVTNSRVAELIQSAYGLQLPTHLVNVPDWARSMRVDVVAKAEALSASIDFCNLLEHGDHPDRLPLIDVAG